MEMDANTIPAPSPWTNPPTFVLLRVLSFTDLRTSVLRFRAVCHSWRSALQAREIVKVPPLEAPTYPRFNSCGSLACVPSEFSIPSLDNNNDLKCCSIHSDSIYFVSPLADHDQAPWLIRAREIQPNKWKVMQLFVNHDENLFVTTPNITAEINLLEYSIEELCSSWYVDALSSISDTLCTVSKKVVGGWNFKGGNYVFTVLILLEDLVHDSSESGLKLLRLDKNGNITINELWPEWECRIIDIAYYNPQFYVFEFDSWTIGIIDPELPSMKIKFIAGPERQGVESLENKVFFLPSQDHLFLVVDYASGAYRFKDCMKKYVLKQDKWERVNCLDDNTFFVGKYVTFTLPFASKRLPYWEPGSICFFRRAFMGIFFKIPEGAEALQSLCCHDFRECLDLYTPEDDWIEPFTRLDPKVYTGIFFPPPPWVKWQCVGANGAPVRFDGFEFKEDRIKNKELGMSYEYDDDSDSDDDDNIPGNFENGDD